MKYFIDPSQEFVAIRTYCRFLEEEGRRETWDEVVDRYVSFIEEERGEIPSKVLKKIKNYMLQLEVMPSMRAVWAAGDAARKNNITMYNCSFVAVDSIDAFSECLLILMCGTGVGFSVEKKYISKLPIVKELTPVGGGVELIEDSREGWAKSVKTLIRNLYDGIDVQFDYSNLREKGARLKTMGGRSSGPEPLITLHNYIREVFSKAQKRKLTSLECHDIMCQIAEIVVVGGVRRSSEISLSDLSDVEMRDAKTGNFPLRRFMANNSAVYYEKPSATDFLEEWAGLAKSGSGERGIFNLGSAKKMGPKRRNLELISGNNPCGEIMLRSQQFCNLSEVIIKPKDDLDDLMEKVECATWIGVIQSTFTKFPFLRRKWKKNCEEERLLGVSLTGQMDKPSLMTPDNLKALKAKAMKIAKKASKIMNVNMSTSITCGKPSGCQIADTLVPTDKGILSLKEIGNVNGQEWQDHIIKVNTDTTDKLSTKFYVNGFSKTKKIRMKSGVILESTPNHKYRLLVNGDYVWVEAKNLNEGDCLPYRVGGYTGGSIQTLNKAKKPYHNVKDIIQPSVLNEDLAYLLGLYCGDGSTHKAGIRIAGDANKRHFLEKAKKIAKDLFNIEGIIYERTSGNNADLYLNSTYLLEFFRVNNLIKNKTEHIEIPVQIRKSKASVIEAFILGFSDADRHVDSRNRTIFCTTSKTMAQQLSIVLRALGQDCSVKFMSPTSTSWGTKMRYRIQTKKKITKHNKGKFSKQIQKDVEYLTKLKLSTLVPDYVESIEDSENYTYDIEVPDQNTFVANSYVSHNTVSQLVNAASGCHPRYAPYYIRRYRISATDPLLKMLRDQGVPMSPEVGQRQIENGKEVKGWSESKVETWVVEFPIKSPDNAITRHNVSAIDQLKHYKVVQENWCEHNQSITVYVKDDEWFNVGNWVYQNWDIINGVSFLPYDGGIYELAPYEEITKEEYDRLKKKFPKIDYSMLGNYETQDHTEGSKSFACVGDKCELT